MNMQDYLKEERIPYSQRLINAISGLITSISIGLITILTAPITFFSCLFTSKRMVWDYSKFQMTNQWGPVDNINPPDNRDDWLKRHMEEYGDEE